MQPIKSVLPFCSALPIQYTPAVGVPGTLLTIGRTTDFRRRTPVVRLPYDMRGYSRCSLYSRRSSSPTCMRRVEVARTRSASVLFRSQWRRNYGDPQVQDLYPLYPPSQRCGLCQHFKQTTLTTRLYKVRTNLYSPRHLRKRSDAPGYS